MKPLPETSPRRTRQRRKPSFCARPNRSTTIPISPPPLPRHPESRPRRRASATGWLPSRQKVETDPGRIPPGLPEIMMKVNRCLAVLGLILLVALPAVRQTGWPPVSPGFQPAVKSAQAAQLVDINAASEEELDKLP